MGGLGLVGGLGIGEGFSVAPTSLFLNFFFFQSSTSFSSSGHDEVLSNNNNSNNDNTSLLQTILTVCAYYLIDATLHDVVICD